MQPGGATRQQHVGTIVLSAADADIGIGRMHRDALELRRSQRRVVLVDPGIASVSRLPNTAIIAAIDDVYIRSCDLDDMRVGVCGCGVGGESCSCSIK